jgi:hypothetical protein
MRKPVSNQPLKEAMKASTTRMIQKFGNSTIATILSIRTDLMDNIFELSMP